MSAVLTRMITPLPPNAAEVMRYARGKPDGLTGALLEECLSEIAPVLRYRLCYLEIPVKIVQTKVDFSVASVESAGLADHLSGCGRAVLFCATVGAQVDRMIARASLISAAKALLFDAIGTERVEALCDAFCAEYTLPHRRFSPGYGDLPLDFQREMFRVLDCPRKIGVSLGENLLMRPTKSVSAILGIRKERT